MHWMKLDLTVTIMYVHVLKPTPPTQELFLSLSEMIISVPLEAVIAFKISGTLKIHCGMEKAVEGEALAVNSTTLHGSVRISLSPPLMILSCGCVVIKILTMKIADWN